MPELRKGAGLVPPGFVAILLAALLSKGIAATNPDLTPEESRVLDGARALALQYTERLPDFICTQVTHREITGQASFGMPFNGASSSRGARGPASADHSPSDASDVIEEKLTFFNQMEHYEVVTVNGKKAVGKEHMNFAGATSAGEFGSALHNIFDPRSHASFEWDRFASLGGRRVAIFKFHVPSENGTIVMDRDTDQKILAAYSGKLFIDTESLHVLRITSALELPIDFPIKLGTSIVDYKPVTIAGDIYILPYRSEVRLKDNARLYVNQIEFQDYHKFAAESTIHYDSDESPKNQ